MATTIAIMSLGFSICAAGLAWALVCVEIAKWRNRKLGV